ncbi:hypothetical protein AAU57_08890 [Nonlabens sp. YIK11]|nr:hypothetical protein AAU57_08890 [Nonlabens sp. YIK11]
MVIHLVNKFSFTTKHTLSDLISYALEGLMIAYHNYDESKSNKGFSSFASYGIRNNLLSLIDSKQNESDIISKPINKETEHPTAYVFSNWDSDDADYKFEDMFEASEPEPDDNDEKLIQLIKDHLKKPNWADVVILHLGLGRQNKLRLRTIAEKYNVTSSRIGQIFDKNIERLQNNPEFLIRLRQITRR